jgi:hypothetical protein
VRALAAAAAAAAPSPGRVRRIFLKVMVGPGFAGSNFKFKLKVR